MQCRKDEIVLCRASIRTHSYILKKDPPPQCEDCQCVLTVCHILVECNHFAEKRKDIYIYMIKEIWWNHLDSTPYSFYFISKSVSFIINFNLYICDKQILRNSLHCVYRLVNF